MSAISIKGLEVSARHGVLAEEKVNPQPFVFDIDIDCQTVAAANSDDVNMTVNYAEVCRLVAAYCGGNSILLCFFIRRAPLESYNSVYEFFGIERLHILYFFTHARKENGDLQSTAKRDNEPAFCGAVEFG